MAQLNDAEQPRRGLLFYVGSAGLLTVMLTEAVAVIGRHAGMPLLGALELCQAAIVPAACAAMLIATLQGAHATVNMLTERLPPTARQWTARIGAVLAAIYFAALSAGAIWLLIEYWDTFEHTEVLQIPFRPLRTLVAISALALVFLFVQRMLRQGQKP